MQWTKYCASSPIRGCMYQTTSLTSTMSILDISFHFVDWTSVFQCYPDPPPDPCLNPSDIRHDCLLSHHSRYLRSFLEKSKPGEDQHHHLDVKLLKIKGFLQTIDNAMETCGYYGLHLILWGPFIYVLLNLYRICILDMAHKYNALIWIF